MTKKLTITRPDDWHLHLRDGDMLAAAVPFTARQFARAIVMPNLTPPVTTADQADAYKARIMAALPEGMDFTPLMTAYLTDDTDPDALAEGFERGSFTAAKLYPANATTNSAAGVTDVRNIYPVLEAMQNKSIPIGAVEKAVVLEAADLIAPERIFYYYELLAKNAHSITSFESICANPWTFPNLIKDPKFIEEVKTDGRFVDFLTHFELL